jgi:hypothetical protein
MKLFNKKNNCYFNYIILFIVFFLLSNCGSVDSLDIDKFNVFNEQEKSLTDNFRRQSEYIQSPLVEFLLDNNDPESLKFNENIEKVCNYTKLPFRASNIELWNNSPVFSPTTRVVSISNTIKLSDAAIDKLTEFVAKGGTFFYPISNVDKRLSYLLGFKPEADHFTDVTSKGFHFIYPLLPDFKGLQMNKEEIHYGFAKENFSRNIKVLATSVNNSEYPIVLENKVGKGKVILYNFQKSFEKRDRGFLFAGILSGLEGIPYPIANTSTIFLDDFPCPLFDIKNEPIASEMNLTSKDFVKNVWWPDMLKISKQFNISYSVLITFDYKNKVEPPFSFNQWDGNKMKFDNKYVSVSEWFAKDASQKGHELAFHGYNHSELVKSVWKNQDFIPLALKAAEKKWQLSDFGNLPVSYVPPSNYIDKMGINKLKTSMPYLKYLCSSFNGELVNGENREFDFDPYNKNFFDYPRITYGYYINNSQKYSQESAYLYTGIWTHFVHPDDVYQISSHKDGTQGDYDSRNPLNLGWYKTKGKYNGLFPEFVKYLKGVTTRFPQIRFLNAGEAANIVMDWRASNFSFNENNGVFTVEELKPEESISGKQYWFLYVNSENSIKIESDLANQKIKFSKTPLLTGFLYTLFTNNSKISLPDLKYTPDNKRSEIISIANNIKMESIAYQENVKKYLQALKIDATDSDVLLKIEIEALKSQMLTEEKINPEIWNKYTKYMNWEEKGYIVWGLLEAHCKKYPIPENILYSKELNTLVEYPNDLIKEKWLSAQMLVTPNDAALLNSYIADFYTPENQNKIKIALLNLLEVDSGFETYQMYLQHLLMYEPKDALAELRLILPSNKYKNLVEDICWLYVDNNEYKKAYDWSFYADNIDFSTRMTWLIELKSYKFLESEYKKHLLENPKDYKAKAVMCSVYFDIGKFRDAWILTNSLPESRQKEDLKATLNNEVIYAETELQQELLLNFPDLFYSNIKQELLRLNRKQFGNFTEVKSSLESNRTAASAFKNEVSYNFHDKSKSLHSVAFTFSNMYKINFEIEDPDNITHSIYGLQYQFRNPENFEKLQYWSKIRGEYSDFGKYYFQFGLGGNYSKNKKFTSAEIKIFPAESGAAYSKNIYRTQGNFYHDRYLFGLINTSFALEANYYTKSNSNIAATTSDSYQGSITTKIGLDNGEEKKSRLIPFIEASYLKSSIGKTTVALSSGYPYWMIENRFYAGGGLGWKFGKEESDFTSRVEASWFYDDYAADFKRLTGEISYQIRDFTALTTSFEIYSQSKFYSNIIQFGIKYNLKKRQKK